MVICAAIKFAYVFTDAATTALSLVLEWLTFLMQTYPGCLGKEDAKQVLIPDISCDLVGYKTNVSNLINSGGPYVILYW